MYSAATLIFFKENTYTCKIILTAPLMPIWRDRRRSLCRLYAVMFRGTPCTFDAQSA